MSVYVSSLLTATAATVNADPASTRTWQWQRNGVNIPGATNSTYSAAPADIGSNLFVVQTETNFLGSNNASASVGPVVAFSPIALFQDGSQGWWYDDDDLTTLFQDSAGTTPVTAVEQFVGLQLDKSKGLVLGPELVTNGTFDTNTTGWAANNAGATFTWQSGGFARFQNTSDFSFVRCTSPNTPSLPAGYYLATFNVISISTGGASIHIGPGTSGNTISTAGQKTFLYRHAGGPMEVFQIRPNTAGLATIDIDNISVRELPGNHRYQTTSGSRPVWSKRVNLLVNTGFTGAVAGNPGTAPASWSFVLSTGSISNVSSDRLTFTASGTRIVLVQALTYTANTTYRSTFVVHENSGISASQLFSWNQSISGAVETFFANGVSQTVSTYIPAPGDVLSYRLAIGATSGNSAIRLGLGCSAIATGQVTISQPDIRPLNQATGLLPLYQRVNTSSDYDTNGFPGYLKADGVDDFLQTNSIDFTATDKITLCAGVRKLSDAATGTVTDQNGATGTNSFMLRAPSGATATYAFFSGGSVAFGGSAVSAASYAAPITNVLTGVGNISGDSTILRINSTQVAFNGGDQGTGNYSNLPVYFFRRQGTALPFNGNEYGNIAVGKLLTADQLTALETYMNGLTKAY